MSELVMMPQKDYKDICDAVRAKTGGTDLLKSGDIPAQIESISTGGGSSVPWNDVTFIDYDGTVLHSYTLEEAQALTELPPLPEQKGLICQGWNWSLEDIKAQNGPVIVGAMYITDDGKTRIYIHLTEGRTSPMLGVGVNGTVTVDWGDGTEPDVLTGTSTSTVKWTPNHNYAKAGNYVISLSVDGEMAFGASNSSICSALLCFTNVQDSRNRTYQNAVKKVEIGNSVKDCGTYSFYSLYSLASVSIPESVTSFESSAFGACHSLANINIPHGVTSIANEMFYYSKGIKSVSVPSSVTSFGYMVFRDCWSLEHINIPNCVTRLGGYQCFYICRSLARVSIPNGVTIIKSSTFSDCSSLASVSISESVTSFESSAFGGCYSVGCYDFSACTSIPTLAGTNVFNSIPADCQMLIPSALFDEWSTATNWATYASYMVAV